MVYNILFVSAGTVIVAPSRTSETLIWQHSRDLHLFDKNAHGNKASVSYNFYIMTSKSTAVLELIRVGKSPG